MSVTGGLIVSLLWIISVSDDIVAQAEEADNYGYVEVPYEIDSVLEETDGLSVEYLWELPQAYDAREDGHVSGIRHQGSWGNCWSYTAFSVLEGSLMSEGWEAQDLSEYHICYYNYKSIEDPFGGTAGDKVRYNGTFYQFLRTGGNVLVGFHALANWVGAVPEEITGASTDTELPYTVDYAYHNDSVHLQQFFKIYKNNIQNVKQAIYTYGGVTASMYYSNYYYNENTYAYYNNAVESANHAVTIIGWDDCFSRENFKIRPSEDGAWLIKNSWGTTVGKDGYQWVSYEELSLGDAMCVLLGERADNYDFNYQYDGSYMDWAAGFDGGLKAGNVFHAQGDDFGELIKAVAFQVDSVNTDYSIQIYKNPVLRDDPESGEPCLKQPITGTTIYQGYYTIQLTEAVKVNKGDIFSVVIELNKEGYINNTVKIVAEKSANWNNTLYTATALDEQSFLKVRTGEWFDFGVKNNCNLRIKAFTDGVKIPFTDVETDQWYYEAICYVYENDLMAGNGIDSDGNIKFIPNGYLTREQFAQVLYNNSGKPTVSISNKFPDVKNDWYTNAVLWANENNIANGTGNEIFGVGDNILRQDLAMMLYKYAMLNGYDLTTVEGELDQYIDAAKISNYAREAMKWAVTQGIIIGKGIAGEDISTFLLDPQGYVTRAECAAIMMKLLTKN